MLHLCGDCDGDEHVSVELEGEVRHVRSGVDGDQHVPVELEGEVRQILVVVDGDERHDASAEDDELPYPHGSQLRKVLQEIARGSARRPRQNMPPVWRS